MLMTTPTWWLLLQLRRNWLVINNLFIASIQRMAHSLGQVEIFYGCIVVWCEISALFCSPQNAFSSSIPGVSYPQSFIVKQGTTKGSNPFTWLYILPTMTSCFTPTFFLLHWLFSILWVSFLDSQIGAEVDLPQKRCSTGKWGAGLLFSQVPSVSVGGSLRALYNLDLRRDNSPSPQWGREGKSS